MIAKLDRICLKALFAEVFVECKGLADAQGSHHDKTRAIDQAQLTAIRTEQSRDSHFVLLGRDPVDIIPSHRCNSADASTIT